MECSFTSIKIYPFQEIANLQHLVTAELEKIEIKKWWNFLSQWWRYIPSSDSQFLIHGYPIIWKDRNKNGGGVLFYIDENISFSRDSQSSIRGYLFIRKDRNKNGGGILFYIDENISFSSDGLQTSIFKYEELSIYLSNANNIFWASYVNITLIRYFILKPGNEK